MKQRMRSDFLTLDQLDKRRKAEHNPSIGRQIEQQIIKRHLRELEELAGLEWLNDRPWRG